MSSRQVEAKTRPWRTKLPNVIASDERPRLTARDPVMIHTAGLHRESIASGGYHCPVQSSGGTRHERDLTVAINIDQQQLSALTFGCRPSADCRPSGAHLQVRRLDFVRPGRLG